MKTYIYCVLYDPKSNQWCLCVVASVGIKVLEVHVNKEEIEQKMRDLNRGFSYPLLPDSWPR